MSIWNSQAVAASEMNLYKYTLIT